MEDVLTDPNAGNRRYQEALRRMIANAPAAEPQPFIDPTAAMVEAESAINKVREPYDTRLDNLTQAALEGRITPDQHRRAGAQEVRDFGYAAIEAGMQVARRHTDAMMERIRNRTNPPTF